MSILRSVLLCWVVFCSTLLWSQTGFHYSYIPKTVYENQIFPVTITGDNSEMNSSISLTFDRSSRTKPLFETPLIVKNGNNNFYTFYFKAQNSNVQIPRLFIHSNFTESSLDPTIIPMKRLNSLNPPKDFSGVLAADMKIKNYQVSNYDEKNHLVTISLKAHEANLEDIFAPHALQSGVEDLKRENAKVTAEFFAVLPREQKNFQFSYFNTVKKRFIHQPIKVELANASVTTQSDLNPKVDAFKRLKRYTLIALTIIFLLMFIWKRDFFYFFLGILALIALMTFYIPHKKICVKQGAPLYILPTQTSTIGTRVDEKYHTMLLGERGEFKKIELKKGVIGWIKDEDICQ